MNLMFRYTDPLPTPPMSNAVVVARFTVVAGLDVVLAGGIPNGRETLGHRLIDGWSGPLRAFSLSSVLTQELWWNKLSNCHLGFSRKCSEKNCLCCLCKQNRRKLNVAVP